MGSSVVEIVAGAVIAILITIWIEYQRKPKLEIRIAEPSNPTYESGDRPAAVARFLGLDLVNKPLPRLFRWMQRNAALQCHGTITFHHLDGQNVFGRAMPIRWSGTPEPVPIAVRVGDTQVVIADPARFTSESRTDVYPGESQRLDVAAKFDDEPESYGWSNLNYFSQPIWRNPAWRLAESRYLVRASVVSSGETVTGVFRLVADVPRDDFRIRPVLKGDVVFD